MKDFDPWKAIGRYCHQETPDAADEQAFVEAVEYLYHTRPHDPDTPIALFDLGAMYYETKRYGLALKYYELAEAMGVDVACLGLGYIWYYGRTGTVDYEKAYHYFSKLRWNANAAYKLADMYHYGHYVQQNEAEYCRRIGALFRRLEADGFQEHVSPEVCLRQGEIDAAQGKPEHALYALQMARDLLAERLRHDQFFGNYTVMRDVIAALYRVTPFSGTPRDLYDLYALLRRPAAVRFYRGAAAYTVTAQQ